jgi:hypothetical protein
VENLDQVDVSQPLANWCDSCKRPIDRGRPATTDVDVCPHCRAPLTPAPPTLADDDDEAPPRTPWHFKVMVFGTIGYLIYRFIWFIGWIMHRH